MPRSSSCPTGRKNSCPRSGAVARSCISPGAAGEGLAFLRGKYPDRAEPELERAFPPRGRLSGAGDTAALRRGTGPADGAVCRVLRGAKCAGAAGAAAADGKVEARAADSGAGAAAGISGGAADAAQRPRHTGRYTEKKILQGRTGAELLAAANNLQTAIDDLNANVGAGAVIGWLSFKLR